MLFNSYAFVFLFFPLCLIGFFLAKRIGKADICKAFLIGMSLWFYGFMNASNVPILLISMVVNYGIFGWLRKEEKYACGRKKLALVTGLLVNLGALFFFKYTGTAFVPLGISFFTFSQISLLMEGYRGNLKEISPLDYGVYITFFPKLVEGPIALPQEMNGQVEKIMERPFDWEMFYRSFCLFILGLSKKVLLADTLGAAVDHGYLNLAMLNSGDAWIVMLSYTLQLYFDFSGYCDMAMGIAGMLGFALPLNFHSPYKAANILEFWKGWHITLTRFFTKYLYIPLGGNRKGRGRTYLNTFIIFLVSGIWHGAGFTFIVWGMMHGVLYVITRWWKEHHKAADSRIGHAFSVIATFLYVNVAWVFFRAPSVKEAVELIQKLILGGIGRINWDLAGCFNLDEFWYVIKVLHIDSWQYAHYILMVLFLLVAILLIFFAKTAVEISKKIRPTIVSTAIMAVLLVWCIITFSEVSSFLYFNF